MAAESNVEDEGLIRHRLAMIARHTGGLPTGWYVLDGFFWDDVCSVIAGPFTTQDDALACRSALERTGVNLQYFIDEVRISG